MFSHFGVDLSKGHSTLVDSPPLHPKMETDPVPIRSFRLEILRVGAGSP